MSQYDYTPMTSHSWMNRDDVEYRFSKMIMKEKENVKTLDDISEGVADFDFAFSRIEQKEERMFELIRQRKELIERLIDIEDRHHELYQLMKSLCDQIGILGKEINDARRSIKTAPKDRANLLNQQLRQLREERTKLMVYARSLY